MKLRELDASIADKVGRMNELVDGLTETNPIFTEAQETEFVELEGKVKSMKLTRERLQTARDLQCKIKEPTNVVKLPDPANANARKADEESGFECLGEFLYHALRKPNDPRLEQYRAEQSMGTGVEGGFAVPRQWSSQMIEARPEEALVQPRATVIEPGDPPDSEITFPALDQTAAQNMYGGVVVEWIGEGGTKPETDMKLRQITLKPEEVAAHIVVTDKLLRNWGAASSILGEKLRRALIADKDLRFILGDGVAKPRGWMNSGATIAVNRAGANAIDQADVLAMMAVFFDRGGAGLWVANRSTIPQLYTLEDAAGNSVFLANMVGGAPMSLMGMPLVFSERVPVLGTLGDLSLVDLSAYMIKRGSGPFVGSDQGLVNYTTNKTIIKIFENVDGQAELVSPLNTEDGVLRSPFITLDVP